MAKTKAALKEEISELARRCLETKVRDNSEPSDQQVKTIFEFAIQKLMRESASIRLATLELLLNYGYGKPVQQIEAKTESTQKFVAHVPPVLDNDAWMKSYGNPVGPVDDLEN